MDLTLTLYLILSAAMAFLSAICAVMIILLRKKLSKLDPAAVWIILLALSVFIFLGSAAFSLCLGYFTVS